MVVVDGVMPFSVMSSLLLFLLLSPSLTQPVYAGRLTTLCFQSPEELFHAVDEYVNDSSPQSTVAQTYGWPIERWCVHNIATNDDDASDAADNMTAISSSPSTLYLSEESIKANASMVLDVDLTGWDRPCQCSDDNGGERQEAATSASAAIGTTGGGTESPNGGSNNTTSNPEAGVAMLYRLVPLKLLAFVLLISLVFAVRQMVDFQRYEGIDPSDQKIAEFELLQLADEV